MKFINSQTGRRIGVGLLCVVAAWMFLRYSPMPDQRLKAGYSSAVLSADGSLLRLTLSEQGTYRIKLHLDEVSPQVVDGFVGYEDQWFRWHYGINPVAVARAASQNLKSGRVVSGASTITMQLARMLERRPRTLASKAVEAFRAMQLEARYSKDEILEHYLNLVPMGGNLEGVGSASLLYFGKLPSQLSLGEAALLVSLPRSPNARRPDRNPVAAAQGRKQVLDRVLPNLEISAPRADAAYKASVPNIRRANPHRAPHLIQRLQEPIRRSPGIRRLSIRDETQALAQSILNGASTELAQIGVANGSMIIVDNHTMRVLAYVGNIDFDSPAEGQINMADEVRSPGSALKPFLYGLAMQAGLTSPRGVLFDIPRDYGGYRPVNFLGTYIGPLPAEEALIRSLNTPAVWLEAALNKEDVPSLGEFLKGMGMTSRGRDSVDPGLSVVLGAHPVSLEEIVGLYAGLANQGRWRPLRFFEDQAPLPATRRMVSPATAFLISDMLSKVKRPDLPNSWEYSPIRGRVAFKTGTSFGFRDAWCVGYTPDYTVGVWLGNATAQGSAGLTAADRAAPLTIETFNQLLRHQDHWFKPPEGVSRREVCAHTGLPPGPYCPSKEEEWFLPGVSPYQPCGVHKPLWVRKKDGKRVHPDCMQGKASQYEQKVVAVWPPDVTRYLRGYKAKFEAIPPAAEDCPVVVDLDPPRIVSPEPYGRYVITRALPRERQRIAFSAQASADVERLYWFVDDYLVGETGPEELFFWDPQLGVSRVGVLDSKGRGHQVRITVSEERRGKAAALNVPVRYAPEPKSGAAHGTRRGEKAMAAPGTSGASG